MRSNLKHTPRSTMPYSVAATPPAKILHSGRPCQTRMSDYIRIRCYFPYACIEPWHIIGLNVLIDRYDLTRPLSMKDAIPSVRPRMTFIPDELLKDDPAARARMAHSYILFALRKKVNK